MALFPDPLRLIGRPLWLLYMRRQSSTVPVGCPSPEPGSNWRTEHVQPSLRIGRYEGTELFLGRRAPCVIFSAIALGGDRASISVWCSPVGVHLCPEIKSGHATDDRLRRAPAKQKKSKKPLGGGVCLLTKGVLISVRHETLRARYERLAPGGMAPPHMLPFIHAAGVPSPRSHHPQEYSHP